MKKVAIVTDSVACLPKALTKDYGVSILPLIINYDGHQYRDGIDVDVDEVYRMLHEKPDQFHTSPASVGEYLKTFQEIAKSVENILCITLSSKLSGLHNSASLAANQFREMFPDTTIKVLDSENAAVGEGLVVTAAIKLANSGKSLDEVVLETQRVIAKVNMVGVMDTLEHVYRTGRVSRLTAKFGSALNIKPVFAVTKGEIRITGVTQNQDKGMKRVLEKIKDEVNFKPVHMAVTHAEAEEAGEKLVEQIQREFQCVETWMTDFSPLMAYATGPRVLAVAYYME